MTHRGMPPEAQAAAGIHGDLLRLSVGLEEPADLIADLQKGIRRNLNPPLDFEGRGTMRSMVEG